MESACNEHGYNTQERIPKSSYTPIVVSALGRNEQETHRSQLLSIKMRVLMTWLAGPGWEIWKIPPPPKEEIYWI